MVKNYGDVIVFFFLFLMHEQGEVQYFIGVQLDGSEHVEPLHNCIPEATADEGAKLVGLYLLFLWLVFQMSFHFL